MQKQTGRCAILAFAAVALVACAIWPTSTRAGGVVYAAMAPVSQYLMPMDAEVALARSAAPASISAGATVMILGRKGYVTAEKGGNGFLCLVERSWGAPSTDPEFWNPRIRGPVCFNPPAARSFVPVYLMKTRLALQGKSKAGITRALTLAFNRKELPTLESGAMCYMLSKQQYLSGADGNWHPHLMFFVAGDAAKSWGANLPGSPVMATNDPDERATVFMVKVGRWSDGTLAPRLGR